MQRKERPLGHRADGGQGDADAALCPLQQDEVAALVRALRTPPQGDAEQVERDQKEDDRDGDRLAAGQDVVDLIEPDRLRQDSHAEHEHEHGEQGQADHRDKQQKTVDNPHSIRLAPDQRTRTSSAFAFSSGKPTPCTWTLTSTTERPVIVSMACLTFSCTARAMSGMRTPYLTMM